MSHEWHVTLMYLVHCSVCDMATGVAKFLESFYYTPESGNPKPDYSRLIQDYQNSWFWFPSWQTASICRKTNQGLWHSSKCHNASDLIWEFHFQGTIFTKKFSYWATGPQVITNKQGCLLFERASRLCFMICARGCQAAFTWELPGLILVKWLLATTFFSVS